MWCLSCFKPSTSEDPFEAETHLVKEVSQYEAENQEAELVALAMQESNRQYQQEEEERRRASELLEKDRQMALAIQNKESETWMKNISALKDKEDEKHAKKVDERLKEKDKREQFEDQEVKLAIRESSRLFQQEEVERQRASELEKDRQIALAIEYKERETWLKNISALKDKDDEQHARTVEESLKEKDKREQFEDEVKLAIQESSRLFQQEEEERRRASELEKNTQIARAIQCKERERRMKRKQFEDQVKKHEQLASRLLQQAKEERRRASELEKDRQIALTIQDKERERQLKDRSALEDKDDDQLARTLNESLKEEDKRKQFEDQVKKDKQLASRLREQEEEDKRRASELEKDAQMALALEYEDRKRLLKDRSTLEVDESLKQKDKRKQFDDQLKKDEQLASRVRQQEEEVRRRASEVEKDTQFALSIQYEERERQLKNRPPLEDKEDEKLKGKLFRDEQAKKDELHDVIVPEGLNIVEFPSQLEENKNISITASLDEDEQRTIWESIKGKGIEQSKEEVEEDRKLPKVNPPHSMCGGCNSAVEHRRSVNVLGVLWHPECFGCQACDRPIDINEVEKHVSNSRGKFHKSCYKRYCYVCKEREMRTYYNHPFWEERYCQAHDSDGTPKCCSCERLQPWGTNYVKLDDGRWLCLECMESSVMDSHECQHLHFDVREFFEGLQMKIEKEFPFLLVEKQALNKAEKEEKHDQVVTRGICLSESQTITSVSKRPRMGPNKQLIVEDTESHWYVKECEVTAILILYGFPRLLTGYLLAHEMMHAYLRLNRHRNLNNVLEEGICQVLGHMWLDAQRYASNVDEAPATSSATPAANEPKKGDCSEFEKKLVEFYKNQIETDESPVYGDGFRKVNHMVTISNLKDTVDEITRRR